MTVHARREKGPCIHRGRWGHVWHKYQWHCACTTEGGGVVHARREKGPGGTVAEELTGALRTGGEDGNEDEGDERLDLRTNKTR